MAAQEYTGIGDRIRQLRLLRGWSQAVLAEAAGLTVEGVSRIERGARSPRVETLRAIGAALSTPVSILLGERLEGGEATAFPVSPDLLAVIEPLLDQPAEVRATAARLVEALVG